MTRLAIAAVIVGVILVIARWQREAVRHRIIAGPRFDPVEADYSWLNEDADGIQPPDPRPVGILAATTRNMLCPTCGRFQFTDRQHVDFGCPSPSYPFGHGERLA